jgi:hypothetical protein
MQVVRPPFAIHPSLFGRGRARILDRRPAERPALSISSDVRLFALTFLGGFLFVSVFIG